MTLKRKTPLRKKAAKKKRTTSPRCDVRGCTRRAEVEIAGEWRPATERTPLSVAADGLKVRATDHLCKSHAKLEADRLARQVVLYRDGYRCQKCGVTDREGAVIQWAHIITRGSLAIRWEPLNSVALCQPHHYEFTVAPQRWEAFISDRWPGRWEELHRLRDAAVRDGSKPDYAEIIASLRSQAASL